MILVLIDFDGVIIDSKKQSLEIFKKCLQKFHNCNNYKLINNLYNKADGFDLLSISKFLGNFFNRDYLVYYKFFTSEWKKIYKKKKLNNSILDFFYFTKNLDVKLVIFSSSDYKNIYKILKNEIGEFSFIQKDFNKKKLLSKKTIEEINKNKKNAKYFINIDDNKFINQQMSKINFISIHYEINKTNKNLTEIFSDTLFKNKINFFYRINDAANVALKLVNFNISKKINKLSVRYFNKYKKENFFNDKLVYLHSISFKNKKLNINSFINYYSLRFLKKNISLAVNGYIVIDCYNYIIAKRKNVITERKKFEFVPSGGLTNFSKKHLLLQIQRECFEELCLKINYKNITITGLYFDSEQNLLDFICKIKLKNSDIFRSKIRISNEHSKFLITQTNYLKKNIYQFTNTSKKIITEIINEK
jgi:hypothetical protein